jgi:hypothetical protein
VTAIRLGRARRTGLAGALCALAVTGALTGCGSDPDEGTNGVGKLPAEEIQAKTKQAAQSANAVRLAGDVVADGRVYRIDMRLQTDGASGSVTFDGATLVLLRVGRQLYVKADAEFWSGQDDARNGSAEDTAAAAAKLEGKFVKVPQKDPSYKRFSGFTDKNELLSGLLTLDGELSTDGHHEVSGIRTIRITGDDGDGGRLDVSLEGSPYPVRLERAGGAGTLTFTAWGKPQPLKEPAKQETVDYGRQLPTA